MRNPMRCQPCSIKYRLFAAGATLSSTLSASPQFKQPSMLESSFFISSFISFFCYRYYTLEHAIREALITPNPAFADAIRAHYKHKKAEVRGWHIAQ